MMTDIWSILEITPELWWMGYYVAVLR